MALNSLKKNSPLFFTFGLLFLIAGFAALYITTTFNIIIVAILTSGLIFLGAAGLSIGKPIPKSFATLNPFKKSLLLLAICILSAFLIGVNYSAYKHNIRLDLTKIKQHTLNETTIDIIKTISKDIQITIFYVGIPPKYLEDLLGEYRRASNGRIKFDIYDPLVRIGDAAQLGNVISGDEKLAIVQSQNERVDIDFKKDPLTEKLLTNAIIKVTRQKRNVYFLAGHGEYDIDSASEGGLKSFRELLEHNNCATQKLMLGTQKKVPPDCDLLIISGPHDPLTKDEEDLIHDYLEKGGKGLFFVESTPLEDPKNPLSEGEKRKNPTFNNILKKWGLVVGDDLVVDLENYVGQDVGCPATRNYPHHKEIVNNIDYTFYIRPRSLTIASDAPTTVKNAPLVFTASQKNSWAEKDKNLKVKFDEEIDTPGPVAIAAIAWEPKDEKNKKASDTKLIVFGDTDFISNNFIQKYSNAQLALNSVAWLTELETVIPIPDKEIKVSKMELTSKQLRLVIVILVTIPILIAFLGCLAWWRQNILSSRE